MPTSSGMLIQWIVIWMVDDVTSAQTFRVGYSMSQSDVTHEYEMSQILRIQIAYLFVMMTKINTSQKCLIQMALHINILEAQSGLTEGYKF